MVSPDTGVNKFRQQIDRKLVSQKLDTNIPSRTSFEFETKSGLKGSVAERPNVVLQQTCVWVEPSASSQPTGTVKVCSNTVEGTNVRIKVEGTNVRIKDRCVLLDNTLEHARQKHCILPRITYLHTHASPKHGHRNVEQ